MVIEDSKDYQLKHVFGVTKCVGFACLEREIAFAATDNVVFHDVQTNSQRFLAIPGDISCIATNQSRSIVAVAVKGSSDVVIYDATTLHIKAKLAHTSSSCVYHVSFNKDASSALVLTNAPESAMTMFIKKKSSYDITSTMQFQGGVLRADICPVNTNLIGVLSSDNLAFFRPSTTKMNTRFIPLSSSLNKEPGKYTTQCWLTSGDLIVGTATGNVLIFGENRELKQTIAVPTASVQCITACPKGFCMGDSGGSFTLFQRASKDNDEFISTRSMQLGGKVPITSVGIVKSNDDVVCLTERSELLRFPLNECDPESITTILPSFNTCESNVKQFIPSFGSLFVDTCQWMPLLAVGGCDGILRIVNHESKNVELVHDFKESIQDLSLHPTGKYVLLSTVKRVCVCSIHQHQIHVVWQIPDIPNASVVKFSRGGDRFGIVINTVVQVHDFNSPDYQNISTLRSHSKSIVAFEFGLYGDELCTIGADAVVCLWDCSKGKVLRRINLLSPAILSGCVQWNERVAATVTADGRFKEVGLDAGTVQLDIKCGLTDKLLATLPSGSFAISSGDGAVKIMRIHGESLITEHLTCSPGRQMFSIAHSHGHLFAASNSCVNVHAMNDNLSTVDPAYRPFDGIIMRSRQDIDALNEETQDVENKISSLKAEHTARLQSLKEEARLEVERLVRMHHMQIAEIRSEASKLESVIHDMKAELSAALDELKAQHSTALLSSNKEAERKCANEIDSTAAFRARCSHARLEFQNEMARIKEQHAHNIIHETEEFHQQMVMANNHCEDIIKTIESLRIDVDKKGEIMEQRSNMEIVALWKDHANSLRGLKRSNQLLLNEKSILQQRYNTMLDDLKELQEQVSSQEESHQTALSHIAGLDDEIRNARQSISEKDCIITHIEGKMSLLSQANLEDEQINKDISNERTQLEYRLQPFEEDVKLKEEELARLNETIKGNSNTLSHLKVELDSAKIKAKQSKQQLASLVRVNSETENMIVSLENKLLIGSDSALSCIDNHHALKTRLRSIAEEFLGDKERRHSMARSNNEMLESIENKVKMLQKAIEQKQKTHSKDMNRLNREYALLVKELECSKENDNSQMPCPIALSASQANVIQRQSKTIADLEMKTLTKRNNE